MELPQIPKGSTTADMPWWYAVCVDAIGKVGFPIVMVFIGVFQILPRMDEIARSCGGR